MKQAQRGSLDERAARRGERASTDQYKSLVITLCSMPVLIDIPRPRSRRLAQYTFFSSRRKDEGNESYWIHVGYFAARAEAQALLKALRRFYPEAFISDVGKSEARSHSAQRTRRALAPALAGVTVPRQQNVDTHVKASPGRLRLEAYTDAQEQLPCREPHTRRR